MIPAIMKPNVFILALLFLIVFEEFSSAFKTNEVDIVNPPGCGQNIPSSLFTGSNTVVGEFPWVALVGYENTDTGRLFYACTGALINARYILSSALCVNVRRSPEVHRLSHVRLGEHNIKQEMDCYDTRLSKCSASTLAIDVGIEETISHPGFHENSFQANDIALIRLDETIIFEDYFGFIAPICLPPHDVNPRIFFNDRTAEVVGWDFGSGHPNDVLMREKLPYVDDFICKNLFKGYNKNRQICMMSQLLRKRCVGDSGSPLSIPGPLGPPYILLGILSYGPIPCGFSKSPSVFTSVSHYRDWIDNNLRP